VHQFTDKTQDVVGAGTVLICQLFGWISSFLRTRRRSARHYIKLKRWAKKSHYIYNYINHPATPLWVKQLPAKPASYCTSLVVPPLQANQACHSSKMRPRKCATGLRLSSNTLAFRSNQMDRSANMIRELTFLCSALAKNKAARHHRSLIPSAPGGRRSPARHRCPLDLLLENHSKPGAPWRKSYPRLSTRAP
jgi:hypothetical protein